MWTIEYPEKQTHHQILAQIHVCTHACNAHVRTHSSFAFLLHAFFLVYVFGFGTCWHLRILWQMPPWTQDEMLTRACFVFFSARFFCTITFSLETCCHLLQLFFVVVLVLVPKQAGFMIKEVKQVVNCTRVGVCIMVQEYVSFGTNIQRVKALQRYERPGPDLCTWRSGQMRVICARQKQKWEQENCLRMKSMDKESSLRCCASETALLRLSFMLITSFAPTELARNGQKSMYDSRNWRQLASMTVGPFNRGTPCGLIVISFWCVPWCSRYCTLDVRNKWAGRSKKSKTCIGHCFRTWLLSCPIFFMPTAFVSLPESLNIIFYCNKYTQSSWWSACTRLVMLLS